MEADEKTSLDGTEVLKKMGDARYRLLFNNVSDSVFVHYGPGERNLPGKIIEVNDIACRRLGYTREELLKLSPPDLDAPETISRVPAMMDKLVREKHALWEGVHLTKDRRRIPVEINNILFHVESTPLILATVRDISERIKAQDQLRFIAEHVSDIIWQLNREIRFTYVSPAIHKSLGYKPSEVIGRSLFDFLRPGEAKSVMPAWFDWFQKLEKGTQEEELTFEIEALHKDGRTVWMEVQCRPLIDAQRKKVIQYNGVTRDITNRRRAELERIQLMNRLNRAEKMESLGILAGGVAHDLNNVLGVIVACSELIKEKIPPGDPLDKYIEDISKASKKSAAIIQDLLTLARRGVVVQEVIDLNHAITDYFQTPEFERLKGFHPQVSFTADLAPGLLRIKGSPVHVEKTIMNLLSNAAEAIAGGGGVAIRTENRHLDKPLTGYEEIPPGEYVVLSVSDEGKGISKEDIGKIFEPFYTKKTMGRSGTGLGLAVVWGTAKDHGGYIDLQSEEGTGSVFSIYFPATREEIHFRRKSLPAATCCGRGESILIVDDVADQRAVAAAVLTRLGFRTRCVESGEEAVAYLGGHDADLVVIDMIMDPGMDGLDTFLEILKIKPAQRAVIVTGYSETERVKKAKELGVGACVSKPYTMAEIGSAIRKALDEEVGR